MKSFLFATTVVLLCMQAGFRAQEVTLTAPAVTGYHVAMVTLIFDSPCRVQILLKANVGEHELSHFYAGQDGCALVKTLTTANLTTASLQRRILDKLIADGVIVGKVTDKPAK